MVSRLTSGSLLGGLSLAALVGAATDPEMAKLTPFEGQEIYQDQVWPYNLPTAEYTSAISTVNAQGTFKVPGYDLTAGPGTNATTDLALDGWNMVVSVTADISLANSDPSNSAHFWSNDTDKSMFFDAAQIGLTPPDSVRSSLNSGSYKNGWSVCATLWPYGLVNNARSSATAQSDTQFDGSCTGILSDQCLKDMAAAIMKNCEAPTPPDSCKDSIGYSGSPVGGCRLPFSVIETVGAKR